MASDLTVTPQVEHLGVKRKPSRGNGKLGRRRPFHKYWILYAMLAPAIIYYIVICYLPMFGIQLAFKDYQFNKGIWGSKLVGFKHFQTFFNSFDAPRLITNTLRIGFMKTVLEFPFPIIFALILNEIQNMKFRKVTQTISYMPHFLSSVVVVTLLQKIFAPNIGAINQIKAALGGDPSTFYLMDAKYFLPLLFIMDLWKGIGWSSIMYLAAMSGIDTSLYEAANIDGANRLQKIWHITLPGIRSTIGLLFIMGIGGIISSGYEQIYLLLTQGNRSVAQTLDTWVIEMGIQGAQFGYASAVGLIQGLVGLLMVVICNRLSRRYTEVSLW